MMNPERYQQIEQLFHSAMERKPEERAAFIRDACADDEALRREVESLLPYDDRARSFIETPPANVAAAMLVADEATMLGRTLGHCRILSRLGAGGMGEVYLAEDTKLGRKVALKLLPPESVADEQAKKRLVREAQTVATLDHPNVCAIHEISEEGGHTFIVMQYIEGETLASRIQNKPPSPKEAIDIALQVADALAEAHSLGVAHRDIKPQNIMVTAKNHVKVLDFGLARVVRDRQILTSQAATESRLTTPGMMVGTVPYMSPEQVRGEALDARSDIFSFGAVLYEMVAGRHPFLVDSPAGTLSEILTKEPLPLARYASDVPDELQRIVVKMLRKDREERYQTAKDLLIDLKALRNELQPAQTPVVREPVLPSVDATPLTGLQQELEPAAKATKYSARRSAARLAGFRMGVASAAALLVLVVLLVALNVGGMRDRWRGDASSARIQSLAVLPLENLSRDPEQEYFADGMTEALIAELSKIRALKVISRTSVMQYKGVKKPLPQIARELAVDGVIEGSVVREGNRVRITVQLIDGKTDRHLWADSYQREIQSILTLQSNVAQAIAEEIKIALPSEEKARLTRDNSVNPEAYEAYLKGRHFWELRSREGLDKALDYFERAVQIDPQYALGYAGLADTHFILGDNRFLSPEETFPRARVAVRKALELDDSLAEAHTTQAALLEYADWDWPGAEREYKRALELNPGYATAHHWYGQFIVSMGRYEEGLAEIKLAQRLDPLSARTNANASWAYYVAGRYDEAIAELQKAIELSPDHAFTYTILNSVHSKMGLHDQAVAEARIAFQSHATQGDLNLARTLALAGKQQEARKILAASLVSKNGYVSPVFVAMTYVALDETENALVWLEKAYAERDSFMVYVLVDPSLDPLRNVPRFKDLLRRMALPHRCL